MTVWCYHNDSLNMYGTFGPEQHIKSARDLKKIWPNMIVKSRAVTMPASEWYEIEGSAFERTALAHKHLDPENFRSAKKKRPKKSSAWMHGHKMRVTDATEYLSGHSNVIRAKEVF